MLNDGEEIWGPGKRPVRAGVPRTAGGGTRHRSCFLYRPSRLGAEWGMQLLAQGWLSDGFLMTCCSSDVFLHVLGNASQCLTKVV